MRSWTIGLLGALLSFSIEASSNRGNASNIPPEIMSRCLKTGEAAVKACTAVIQSPHAQPSEIAKAYATRGWLYITKGQQGKGDDNIAAVLQRLDSDDARLAIADFDRAIELDPSTVPEAFAGRGAYRFFHDGSFGVHLRQSDRAVEDLTQAINLNPPKEISCNALLFRGQIYGLTAKFHDLPTRHDLEIEDYSQVIRHCDKKFQSRALMDRALVYRVNKHQYDRAIDDLTAAIRINPRNAEALYQRALAEKELGRTADAEKDVQAARRIDPSVGN